MVRDPERDPETQEQKETHPGSSDAHQGPQARRQDKWPPASLPPTQASSWPSLGTANPGCAEPQASQSPRSKGPSGSGAH